MQDTSHVKIVYTISCETDCDAVRGTVAALDQRNVQNILDVIDLNGKSMGEGPSPLRSRAPPPSALQQHTRTAHELRRLLRLRLVPP